MKHGLIYLILSLIAIASHAQTKVNGAAEIKIGAGTEAPWAGRISLDFKTPKLILQPYAGISAIGSEASATIEDIDYTYSRTKNSYFSTKELKSNGTRFNYGLDAKYLFGKGYSLGFFVHGDHSSYDIEGWQKEGLRLADGSLFSFANSNIVSPTKKNDNVNAGISLRHDMDRKGEFITLAYQFLLKKSNSETLYDYSETSNNIAMKTNEIEEKRSVREHSVSLDWTRPLSKAHTISLGAGYIDRLSQCDDRQFVNGPLVTDGAFSHKMQTLSATLGYRFAVKAFDASAKVSYMHTKMWDKNYNDIVPIASIGWHMDARNTLRLSYATRIIRPGLDVLCPTKIVGPYTLDYGNPALEGTHAKNLSLQYALKGEKASFQATLSHIFADDGITAIWMEKEDVRVSTYGNEGVRRAWSLTPQIDWKPSPKTSLMTKATLMWDKRVAYAISMAKEHWGITTSTMLTQQLPLDLLLKLNCDYSEGNTLDLYSHSGKAISYGAELQRSFLASKKLSVSLAYSHTDAPKTILTQGAYTGTVFSRPRHSYKALATLAYKF